jgi:hypothetical protein
LQYPGRLIFRADPDDGDEEDALRRSRMVSFLFLNFPPEAVWFIPIDLAIFDTTEVKNFNGLPGSISSSVIGRNVRILPCA